MKCENCGAEIKKGMVYCNVCGKEVRIVPDYNFLEDELLSAIVEEGQKEALGKKTDSEKETKVNTKFEFLQKEKTGKDGSQKKKKKKIPIWPILCIIVVAGALTAVILNAAIQNSHANSFDYQYQNAKTYFEERNYTQALLYYENALALKPDSIKVKQELADLYLKLKKPDKARVLLLEVIEKEPSNREAYEKLIDIYAEKEEYTKIQELCESLEDNSLLDLFDDYMINKPTFNKISGHYGKKLSIEISSSFLYEIYYTLDGSDPIENGILYEDPIELTEGSTTIQAVTKDARGIYSEITKATYSIQIVVPAAPTVSPDGGGFNQPQMVTISVPPGCNAYYTWDSTKPTTASALYTEPIPIPEGEYVLSVVCVNSNGIYSSILQRNFSYIPG